MLGYNTLFLVITKFCRCFSLQKATPCFIFCFFHFCHVHAIHVSYFINRWCYQMMSLSNTLRVVSPEVIKGITIHSPCCHSWVSHLGDVAISRIPVFCVKWTLSADQPYQGNCTIAMQSQTWWPVWDPELENELCGSMELLGVMAARASKGQPELHTRTQRRNEKSCMCSFLSLQSTFACSLGIHPRCTPWEFIPSQLHLPWNEWKFREERLLAQDYGWHVAELGFSSPVVPIAEMPASAHTSHSTYWHKWIWKLALRYG